MRHTPSRESRRFASRYIGRLWPAALAIGLGLAGHSGAQEEAPTIGGFPPILPPPPQGAPRPATGRESVSEFVESLGTNDAAFEVVVRQGRLLTLKEPLVDPNQPSPVIAVGDPSVIEFEVLSPRQVRITGQKLGVTDLAITTGSGQTYSFVIQIVADLPVLRGQLKQLFPDATLRLSQIRDHIVVEGQARDPEQHDQILRTIRAYLRSIQESQKTVQERAEQDGGGSPATGGRPAAPGPAPAPGAAPAPGVVPAPGAAPAPRAAAPRAAAPRAAAPRDERWTKVSMQAAAESGPTPGGGGRRGATLTTPSGSLNIAPGTAFTTPSGTVSVGESNEPEVIDLIRVPAPPAPPPPPPPLQVFRSQLRELFPDAKLRLTQVRGSLIVEGEARDADQVSQILDAIQGYLDSITQNPPVGQGVGGAPATGGGTVAPGVAPAPGADTPGGAAGAAPAPGAGYPPNSIVYTNAGTVQVPSAAEQAGLRIINRIRVPGSQQVLLKVRVAELNRTSMRRIGGDLLAQFPEFGSLLGTRIGGASVGATTTAAGANFASSATTALGSNTTAFAIFPEAHFQLLLSALRQNSLLKILAEPNLVALDGHQASFLAGGEFPVPVPQSGAGGGAATITIQYKEFGVRLGFLPFVLDNDVVRLTIDPEVSSLDFSAGVTLSGTVVPGLNTRRAHTTVELQQGQTLAIAGLLQLTLDGSTTRIPGLGDLPILGPFFSNTTSGRMEKELVVLVTPYLVEPMNADQVPHGPGDEVKAPNDLELYFLNRIEGRTGKDVRATTTYDDPLHIIRHMILEKKYIRGLFGFSD
jgi:Flp pilus assembly secretin CpaC